VYLPAARSDAAVAALGGRVFVLGGIAHGGHSGERATVFVQGDGVPAWHRATDMPQPRAGGAAVAAGGRLYVVGGLLFPIGGRLLPQPMLVYSPSSNSWMSVEVPGPARAQPAVAEASFHGHPTLFIFGGETATGGVAPSLSYDTVTGAFFRLPAPPVPMLDTTAASVGGVVYLFGSATLEGYERPTVVAYRPERRTYTMRTPIPHPIAGVTWMSGTSAVIDGRVWIVADDPAGRRVDVYDPATNSWMRARDLTLPQRGGSAVAVGRTLSVIGGTKPIDNGNAVGEIRTVQVLHARD
jgi:N-acetylneuraminic acid mutarotase